MWDESDLMRTPCVAQAGLCVDIHVSFLSLINEIPNQVLTDTPVHNHILAFHNASIPYLRSQFLSSCITYPKALHAHLSPWLRLQ